MSPDKSFPSVSAKSYNGVMRDYLSTAILSTISRSPDHSDSSKLIMNR